MSRLPPKNAAGYGDVVCRDLKQVVIDIRTRCPLGRRNHGTLVSIAANGIGPSLDRELRAEYSAFGRELLDDDISTARKLPGVEWCWTRHAAKATGAFIEMVRDVADLPGASL